MKIHLANQSQQGLGGGWTFMHNLRKGLELIKADVEFVEEPDKADIFFISGSSMIKERELVYGAKSRGQKVVLRIDNIARNSRNSNCGTTKLYDYAQVADWVVFQSKWAKKKIEPLLNSSRDEISNEFNNDLYGHGGTKTFDEARSSVIINGVDTRIFSPDGDKTPKTGIHTRYLIVRYNRDNNKRIEEAFDLYTEEWLENKNIELWIVGNFSRDMVVSHFDFYLGERFNFKGVIENRTQLAGIYRSCDNLIYPSYSDACPNTVLEARACGLHVIHRGHAGIPEVMDEDLDISLERMAEEYYNLFKELL